MEKLGKPAVTACPQLPIHPLARPERASASRQWIQAKNLDAVICGNDGWVYTT